LEVVLYDTIDSTNSQAWRLLQIRKNCHGLAVQALQQTQGRGQGSHSWFSPVGGLYLSLILEMNQPIAKSAEITLWSAWIICTHLNQQIDGSPIRIKWRNDLFLHDRKLGGILVETRLNAHYITHAVIGVGINWQNSVPDGAIALSDIPNSKITSLTDLVSIVQRSLIIGYEHWIKNGMEEITENYNSLLINKPSL
jgi:BirA family biotin operon repressor/biotin-[acetyl-CoA-carboxylase] ligase